MTTLAPDLDDAVLDRLEAEFLLPSDAERDLIAGLAQPGPGWWDEQDEQLRITRYRTMNRGCCG